MLCFDVSVFLQEHPLPAFILVTELKKHYVCRIVTFVYYRCMDIRGCECVCVCACARVCVCACTHVCVHACSKSGIQGVQSQSGVSLYQYLTAELGNG